VTTSWAGGGSGVNNTTNYAYDSLNRLQRTSMANHYSQTYNIDRYGNMVCSGNYCNVTVAFDPATNRITTSGFTYDAAGNLMADGTGLGTHSFQWDAEGRMVSVDGVAGQSCQSSWTDCFTYNALGQRVQKHIGSPASDTYYYYDAFGSLAMTKGASQVNEYLFPGNFGKYYWTGSAWETDYTHANSLGSTQVVTRADGTCAEAEVFYPFGGKRWRGCGGTQDVRFASFQERDLETETWQDTLDPTWFRTYTSGLGRWFSPDPLAGDITAPQSLNRYAYVLNNPTTFIDPLGLDPRDKLNLKLNANPSDEHCLLDGIMTSCSVVESALGSGAALPVGVPSNATLDFQSGSTFVYSWQEQESPPAGYIPCPSGAVGCYRPNDNSDTAWWARDHIVTKTASFSIPNTPLRSLPGANNGTPTALVVLRDNGKSIPNVPPDWRFCSAYRDGTGAGDALYHLCMAFPNGPVSNCMRGKLLNQYTPNPNPLQLVWYLFPDHGYDLVTCAAGIP